MILIKTLISSQQEAHPSKCFHSFAFEPNLKVCSHYNIQTCSRGSRQKSAEVATGNSGKAKIIVSNAMLRPFHYKESCCSLKMRPFLRPILRWPSCVDQIRSNRTRGDQQNMAKSSDIRARACARTHGRTRAEEGSAGRS